VKALVTLALSCTCLLRFWHAAIQIQPHFTTCGMASPAAESSLLDNRVCVALASIISKFCRCCLD